MFIVQTRLVIMSRGCKSQIRIVNKPLILCLTHEREQSKYLRFLSGKRRVLSRSLTSVIEKLPGTSSGHQVRPIRKRGNTPVNSYRVQCLGEGGSYGGGMVRGPVSQ